MEAIILSVTDSRSVQDIISLSEVKNYLRVTNTQDDNEIQDEIDNAIDAIERYLDIDILAKSRQMYIDCVDEPINLYYAPINTSVDISVTSSGNAEEGFDMLGIEDPKIRFGGRTEDVVISYTTKGITDLSKIKQGIKRRVADLYFARGEATMNTNWKLALSPYRRYGFYGTR